METPATNQQDIPLVEKLRVLLVKKIEENFLQLPLYREVHDSIIAHFNEGHNFCSFTLKKEDINLSTSDSHVAVAINQKSIWHGVAYLLRKKDELPVFLYLTIQGKDLGNPPIEESSIFSPLFAGSQRHIPPIEALLAQGKIDVKLIVQFPTSEAGIFRTIAEKDIESDIPNKIKGPQSDMTIRIRFD